AAGYVDARSAIIIGGVAGVLCYFALLFRVGRGLDESCDAWAVHGMGGLWGAIATGIFATSSVNSFTGLIYGNVHQFTVQIMAACASVVYAFVMTYILARIVDSVMGLRVTEEEEYVGLDISQHGEKAYA
ncbi:MAG TPA: ammonium transporter, partial [Methanothrix sp.]|nr:ammonium transporter [Methanothrix sp.]